jgi:AcrR family transcriptional regulator
VSLNSEGSGQDGSEGEARQGRAAATRRRGPALDAAILDAAWEQLTEGGYSGFTFEAVAERAGTSRPVLYRRWPARTDLLRATLHRYWDRNPVSVPDTGSLRDDTVELLLAANEQRAELAAIVSVHLGAYFDETGSSPAELRRELLAGRPAAMQIIIDRAVERGEFPASAFTLRVTRLPFELFRSEMLMTLRPLSRSTITDIVDEVFLPLVEARTATLTKTAAPHTPTGN